MGLDISGYIEHDHCKISYWGFDVFREWCLDLMPLDFQLAFRLWMDSKDPEPKVPEGWMNNKYTAWAFFSHSDSEGEFWDTDDMAEFLRCLKDRASCRIRDNERSKSCYEFLCDMERVFRTSNLVIFH